MLPALKVVPFPEWDDTLEYLREKTKIEDYEAALASFDTELTIEALNPPETGRYFDVAILYTVLRERINAVLKAWDYPVNHTHRQPSPFAYGSWRTLSIQKRETLVRMRENPGDVYKIFVDNALSVHKPTPDNTYYFEMQGIPLCAHCHTNEALYQDTLLDIPLCGEVCRDDAFATHAVFL